MNVEVEGRGDSSLLCFIGTSVTSPRSGERVQGMMFPAGVWGETPSGFGRQPNVTPLKKDVVSEQNAEHSAIETGSS